jgi:hypothetical protein
MCILTVDHPATHRCRVIGCIADKAASVEIITPFDRVEHRPSRFDFVRTIRWSRLDVHEIPCWQTNQMVGRAGKAQRSTSRGCQRAVASVSDIVFGGLRLSSYEWLLLGVTVRPFSVVTTHLTVVRVAFVDACLQTAAN